MLKHSFLVKLGVMLLVFFVILLSGCQPQKEIEPVVDKDAPKLWSVMKPLSEEEKLKQRKYINTKPGDEFPIPGIEDGFVILTSGSDTLYEELCMEDLLQLADLAPVTLLIAGLAPLRSEPFYEVMTLPSNSEVVKLKLSDLLSLGFEQDYLKLIKYFHPTIWQIENGRIRKQYFYYAVGQYEELTTYFAEEEGTNIPLAPGAALPEFQLVRSDTQENEIVQITKPTLLIHWSMENPLPQLKSLLDSLKDKVQVILVLQVTDTRTRYPTIMNALNTRANTEDKIERLYINAMNTQTERDLQYSQDLQSDYPDLLVYEDQSYEMIRVLQVLQQMNPKLVEADDRSVMVYMFYLFNEKGVLANEWLCRLTLGNKEDTVLMLNILEKAIDELKR